MIATAQITITKIYDGQESYSIVRASKVPSNPPTSLIVQRSGVALNPLQRYNPSVNLTTFAANNPVKVSFGQGVYCYYGSVQILEGNIIVFTPSSEKIDTINNTVEQVKQDVKDMSDDDKITVSEKKSLRIEWESVKDEHTKLINIASNFTNPTYDQDIIDAKSSYDSWFNDALTVVMNTVLADPTTTTSLNAGDGEFYKLVWTTYYEMRNTLSTAISNAIKITYDSKFIQQANKIGLVVTETAGTSVINTAGIVAAINDGNSKIDMAATNINLSGYVTFTDLEISNASTVINGNNITTGSITADKIKAGELVVGTNVSMGANATIDWSQVDTTGASASDIGALDDSYANRLTKIGQNGIYTGSVDAAHITGTTFNIVDYMQFVKGDVALFTLSANADGTAGQLYFNDTCSIDVNGADLRMKVANNNYIRINSGGGFDYYFPTGAATYKVIPVVDSNGNLCSTAGATTLVFG
jgi:hypothetical protein